MYKLYAGNSEQFVFSLNTLNLAIAKNRCKRMLCIRDKSRLRKEDTPQGYPKGTSHYSYVWSSSRKPRRVVRRKFMLLKELI